MAISKQKQILAAVMCASTMAAFYPTVGSAETSIANADTNATATVATKAGTVTTTAIDSTDSSTSTITVNGNSIAINSGKLTDNGTTSYGTFTLNSSNLVVATNGTTIKNGALNVQNSAGTNTFTVSSAGAVTAQGKFTANGGSAITATNVSDTTQKATSTVAYNSINNTVTGTSGKSSTIVSPTSITDTVYGSDGKTAASSMKLGQTSAVLSSGKANFTANNAGTVAITGTNFSVNATTGAVTTQGAITAQGKITGNNGSAITATNAGDTTQKATSTVSYNSITDKVTGADGTSSSMALSQKSAVLSSGKANFTANNTGTVAITGTNFSVNATTGAVTAQGKITGNNGSTFTATTAEANQATSAVAATGVTNTAKVWDPTITDNDGNPVGGWVTKANNSVAATGISNTTTKIAVDAKDSSKGSMSTSLTQNGTGVSISSTKYDESGKSLGSSSIKADGTYVSLSGKNITANNSSFSGKALDKDGNTVSQVSATTSNAQIKSGNASITANNTGTINITAQNADKQNQALTITSSNLTSGATSTAITATRNDSTATSTVSYSGVTDKFTADGGTTYVQSVTNAKGTTFSTNDTKTDGTTVIKGGTITSKTITATDDVTAGGYSLKELGDTVSNFSDGALVNTTGIERTDTTGAAAGTSTTTIEKTLSVDGVNNIVKSTGDIVSTDEYNREFSLNTIGVNAQGIEAVGSMSSINGVVLTVAGGEDDNGRYNADDGLQDGDIIVGPSDANSEEKVINLSAIDRNTAGITRTENEDGSGSYTSTIEKTLSVNGKNGTVSVGDKFSVDSEGAVTATSVNGIGIETYTSKTRAASNNQNGDIIFTAENGQAVNVSEAGRATTDISYDSTNQTTTVGGVSLGDGAVTNLQSINGATVEAVKDSSSAVTGLKVAGVELNNGNVVADSVNGVKIAADENGNVVIGENELNLSNIEGITRDDKGTTTIENNLKVNSDGTVTAGGDRFKIWANGGVSVNDASGNSVFSVNGNTGSIATAGTISASGGKFKTYANGGISAGNNFAVNGDTGNVTTKGVIIASNNGFQTYSNGGIRIGENGESKFTVDGSTGTALSKGDIKSTAADGTEYSLNTVGANTQNISYNEQTGTTVDGVTIKEGAVTGVASINTANDNFYVDENGNVVSKGDITSTNGSATYSLNTVGANTQNISYNAQTGTTVDGVTIKEGAVTGVASINGAGVSAITGENDAVTGLEIAGVQLNNGDVTTKNGSSLDTVAGKTKNISYNAQTGTTVDGVTINNGAVTGVTNINTANDKFAVDSEGNVTANTVNGVTIDKDTDGNIIIGGQEGFNTSNIAGITRTENNNGTTTTIENNLKVNSDGTVTAGGDRFKVWANGGVSVNNADGTQVFSVNGNNGNVKTDGTISASNGNFQTYADGGISAGSNKEFTVNGTNGNVATKGIISASNGNFQTYSDGGIRIGENGESLFTVNGSTGDAVSKGDITSTAEDGTEYSLNTVGANTAGITRTENEDGSATTTIEGKTAIKSDGSFSTADGKFTVDSDGNAVSQGDITSTTKDGTKYSLNTVGANTQNISYNAQTGTTVDGVTINNGAVTGVTSINTANDKFAVDSDGNVTAASVNDVTIEKDADGNVIIGGENGINLTNVAGIERTGSDNDGYTTTIEGKTAIKSDGSFSTADGNFTVDTTGNAVSKGDITSTSADNKTYSLNTVGKNTQGITAVGTSSSAINGIVLDTTDGSLTGSENGDIVVGSAKTTNPNDIINLSAIDRNTAGITRTENADGATTTIEGKTTIASDGSFSTADGNFAVDADGNAVSQGDITSTAEDGTEYSLNTVGANTAGITRTENEDGSTTTTIEGNTTIASDGSLSTAGGKFTVDGETGNISSTFGKNGAFVANENGAAIQKGNAQTVITDASVSNVYGDNSVNVNKDGVGIAAGKDNQISVTTNGIGLQGGTSDLVMNSTYGAVFNNGTNNGTTTINGGTITTDTLKVNKLELGNGNNGDEPNISLDEDGRFTASYTTDNGDTRVITNEAENGVVTSYTDGTTTAQTTVGKTDDGTIGILNQVGNSTVAIDGTNGTTFTNSNANNGTTTINGSAITSTKSNVTRQSGDEQTGSLDGSTLTLTSGDDKSTLTEKGWNITDGTNSTTVTAGGATFSKTDNEGTTSKTVIDGGTITTDTLNVNTINLSGQIIDGNGNQTNGTLSINKNGSINADYTNDTTGVNSHFTNGDNGTGTSFSKGEGENQQTASSQTGIIDDNGTVGIKDQVGNTSTTTTDGKVQTSVQGENGTTTVTTTDNSFSATGEKGNGLKVDTETGETTFTGTNGGTFDKGAYIEGGATDTTINGNTITTGKITTDVLEIKGTGTADDGKDSTGGSVVLKGDGSLNSTVKDGDNSTSFNTDKDGVHSAVTDGTNTTKTDTTATGTTTNVTDGTNTTTTNTTATGTTTTVTDGTNSSAMEQSSGGINVTTTTSEGSATTAITGSDVTINKGTDNAISLSQMGKVGDIDSELTNNSKYNGTVVGAVNAEADIRRSEISRVDSRIDTLNERVGDVEERLDKVGAMAAAIANLRTMGYDPQAPTEIAIGVGQYKSETGIALGMFHYPNQDFMLSLSVSTSGDEVMGGIGATWKLGRKGGSETKSQPKAEKKVSKEVQRQQKVDELKVSAAKAKVEAQKQRHAQLLSEIESIN